MPLTRKQREAISRRMLAGIDRASKRMREQQEKAFNDMREQSAQFVSSMFGIESAPDQDDEAAAPAGQSDDADAAAGQSDDDDPEAA